jgi:hypothetical protein
MISGPTGRLVLVIMKGHPGSEFEVSEVSTVSNIPGFNKVETQLITCTAWQCICC